MRAQRRRICFVAPTAWSVLARDRKVALVGGAEVQQATLARELARRGHDVSMVCMDHGQPEAVVIDGVRVHRMHAPGAGLPVLRFVHPGFSSVWRAMARADAEIYYQRSAGALTAMTVAFARQHGRRAVYASACDLDFDPAVPLIKYGRDRFLYRWGVRHADAVVAQTARQQRDCLSLFGTAAMQISSCHTVELASAHQTGDVIWVGSVKALKRPELFIELARRLPNFRFRLIGGGSTPEVQALQAIGGLPNLHFEGFVPHVDVGLQFDGASVLVNTSVHEGFPNTFLQAWSRGVPTLAFFDPEVTFQSQPMSEVAASLDDLVARLQRFKSDAAHWASTSQRVRHGFERQYAVASAVDSYEALFDRLIAASAPAQSARA